MNREELTSPTQYILEDVGSVELLCDPEMVAEKIADALWPVLAQVWQEGYEQGHHDGKGYGVVELQGDERPNPYGEVPT